MKQGISLKAVGHATSLFLAITFSLCVGFDLLFPAHAHVRVLAKTAPWFRVDQLEQLFSGVD